MVPSTLSYVIVILFFTSSLASNDESANVYLSPENDTESRLEVPPKFDINNSAITDEEKTPRDKRALGVILQGLVEALGYTVSPISYASLPNLNTTPPTPPPKPIATSSSAPGPATTMAPRQRETLRFTGVVNFGNNSDLLGHLQQYERIFHGNATSTAAPAAARPPAPAQPPRPPGPASGKPALLTPFFVPIPLPLAPNLPPLPASAPRRAMQMELTYAKQKINENYERESQEISDEKDVRKDPPERDSDRDTYIDEPRWKKTQREKQEDERKKHREENETEPDSSEENDEIEEKNKYREEKIVDREREDAEHSKKKQQQVEEEKESVEEDREEDDNKNSNRKDEEESEDSREGEEYAKKSEDTDDDRENASSERASDDEGTDGDRSTKSNADDEDTTSRSDYDRLEKPFGYSSTKCPPTAKQFGNRLPIRVFDVPFSIRGELRNSYGESLEQDGKIDESVADYFQKYKDSETGLFDSRKVQNLQGLKEKDLWWRNDQASALGMDGDPLERIRQEYAPPANKKYEKYNSEWEDDEAGEQESRKDEPKEREYDEEVESTEVKSRPVKGREGTTTSKNPIQYPGVPANRRYEEYNSAMNDGGVEVERSRKTDSEAEDYDERVESSKPKYRPATGRGRGPTFKDTIQQPRVPANRKYEEYNPKRNDGEEKEQRNRNEDSEERKYDERVESTEVKSRPVKGPEGTTTSKNTSRYPGVPANRRYEEYNSAMNDGGVEVQGSRKTDSEAEDYDEIIESTKPKYRTVTGRDRGRTFKDTTQQPRIPANRRYEEYNPKRNDGEEGEQTSRNEDSEERTYDERVESTEVKSRPVKGREGTTTSKNTIQHARVPANTWYEQYNSEMNDGEVGEQKSRKKDPEEEEYDERVDSTEPKYRPVKERGRGRTFKNTIQQLRVPDSTTDSRYEEYASKRDDGEVREPRSRNEDSEEKKYDETVESTEPKHRSVKGRDRGRLSKNAVQHPRAPATTRYEEYSLPKEDDEVGEQRGRKEDREEKVQTTDAKYRPVKGQGRARAFKKHEEDERAGPTVKNGRTEVREKEATSRDEDAKDEIAEPTVTTYTRINSLEEIGTSNYEDGSKESREASQYEPSSERINLPDYDSAEESTSLSKFQLFDPKNPLLFKGFDFIKYSPYFRPIQVSYEPAKLQRTAARILSYHNFGDDASEDKSKSAEQLRDKSIGSSQRPATAAVGSDEYITHNPYLKPIQVAYEPEKLQRTADRILSYHNAVGPDKSREEAKRERIRNEEGKKEDEEEEKRGEEEQKEREEEQKEEDRSEHKSKENDDSSQGYEEEDSRSADNASEDDGPSQNYKDRENYEDRENSSVDNLNKNDGPSRNDEEREDRSSVNREMENDARPGVGLPQRLTGRKLHEGESKELRAWPAPFDHTFDSTERAKVVRLPKSEVSTKIRDEDVEPTYETPAVLEFQSTRPTQNYPPDADVSPTYETRWSVELRASGPTGHYPLDSDVSPTDESPSVEISPSPEPPVSRSNSEFQRRPQSDAKKSSVTNDDLEKEREQSRVTKVDARNRPTVQPSRHKYREESESPNTRDSNPTIHLQIFKANEGKDFSEEGYRPEQQRHIGVEENLRPSGQPRKFDDPESAHDFFGFSRDDYVLRQDANNAPKYGEHVQQTTTPSESNEKELMGLLVISHDPNHQHEVTLTKFTEEPETETERVKVNEYRNKVATLKVSEQRQSTPHGPIQHVGFTRSL